MLNEVSDSELDILEFDECKQITDSVGGVFTESNNYADKKTRWAVTNNYLDKKTRLQPLIVESQKAKDEGTGFFKILQCIIS